GRADVRRPRPARHRTARLRAALDHHRSGAVRDPADPHQRLRRHARGRPGRRRGGTWRRAQRVAGRADRRAAAGGAAAAQRHPARLGAGGGDRDHRRPGRRGRAGQHHPAGLRDPGPGRRARRGPAGRVLRAGRRAAVRRPRARPRPAGPAPRHL
ncbi:MAG: ABC transporter, permease protein (cluster 13, osmolytes), partial [uncultured Blastococcus sp.]